MSRCPACQGLLRREPAAMTCRLCGRWAAILDAPDEAWRAQLYLDWALRPHSVECLAPGEDGWWPSAVAPRLRRAESELGSPKNPVPK